MSNLNPAGPAFEDLTLDEMIASQGSGDVKAETTVPCVTGLATLSSVECANQFQNVTTAIALSYAKKC